MEATELRLPSSTERVMAISRMFKFQLLCHDSIRDEVKLFLRESGVAHITDGSVESLSSKFDEDALRDVEQRIEKLQFSIDFLSQYVEKPSFIKKLSSGPIRVSRDSIRKILHEVDIDEVYSKCSSTERRLRKAKDEIAKSSDLVNSLLPWSEVNIPLEKTQTEKYAVDFWLFSGKKLLEAVDDVESEIHDVAFEEYRREKDRVYIFVISPRDKRDRVIEKLKFHGGYRFAFEGLKGTPSEVVESEREREKELRASIVEIEGEARALTSLWNDLLVLFDFLDRGMDQEKRCGENRERIEREIQGSVYIIQGTCSG